jgi:hypothetical protein
MLKHHRAEEIPQKCASVLIQDKFCLSLLHHRQSQEIKQESILISSYKKK